MGIPDQVLALIERLGRYRDAYRRARGGARCGGAGSVDVKKPAVDIKHNVGPACQLRRDGWNAKLALSVLTDFEERAVYDCRATPRKCPRPDGQAVDVARTPHQADVASEHQPHGMVAYLAPQDIECPVFWFIRILRR